MEIKDDRTADQVLTHRWAVVARDTAMSYWGGAKGGVSRCAWACPPDVNIDRVYNWVQGRTEMQYVNIVDLNTYKLPKNTAHFHIYVVNDKHPAAKY